ncbi:MAG: DUF6273 domain-containing protein, partial [Christensenellales bacterium]
LVVSCIQPNDEVNATLGQTTSPDISTPTKHIHVYGEWKIITKATCLTSGIKEHTCSCGESETETIPALGHAPDVNGICTKCETILDTSKFIYNTSFSTKGYYKTNNNIFFGAYPQTEVTDETLAYSLTSSVGDLPTINNAQSWTPYHYYNCYGYSGYYIEGSVSNYMWYIDKEYNGEKYRGVYFTSYRLYYRAFDGSSDNSYQDDNGYYTSTVYWFKYEPIKWRILDETEKKALISADLALDSQPYDYAGGLRYNNNYAASSIRAWLNNTFYNTAFNDLQKELIQVTNVDNSVNSTGYSGNRYICENTNDNVFLLSYKEASTYCTSDSDLQIKISDYAKSQGIFYDTDIDSNYDPCCLCWLRSPYNESSVFARVALNHYYIAPNSDYASIQVYRPDLGVIPALTIRLQ